MQYNIIFVNPTVWELVNLDRGCYLEGVDK